MSAWDAYPDNYRSTEIRSILNGVRAGECVALVGLSGAGKSNLLGFLFHRKNKDHPAQVYIDGNRAQPRTAESFFRLINQSLGSAAGDLPGIEAVLGQRIAEHPQGLCLLIDRFDALSEEEQALTYGPLRALRDSFKYQLTYVIATRHPLNPTNELAELFYANTLWLGPLSLENALWSATQYAARRGQNWDDQTLQKLVEISWGYPSLLRACCEAYAAGCSLETEALREHPAVQRRVQEFWADGPRPDDVRRSGLSGQPLLNAAQPAIFADSPNLTASEHRLLAHFQAHPGEVCDKENLIIAVWPEDRVVDGLRDDSLAQLIRRLRQKIGAERIQTIPGRGYRYQSMEMNKK